MFSLRSVISLKDFFLCHCIAFAADLMMKKNCSANIEALQIKLIKSQSYVGDCISLRCSDSLMVFPP